MVLDTGRTAPCKVRRVREGEANAWLEVTLREGKKRQVRLMLERIGHPVSKLIRTRYANLSLGELPLRRAVDLAARITGGRKNELYKLALVLKQRKS